MEKIKFVDLQAQYKDIREDIDEAIARVIRKSAFILGEEVSRFEEEFAGFCGTRFAVGMSSGSTALHAALLAYGIGPGDEVITVPNTFIATASAVTHAGARVVFIDVDPESYNIDVSLLEAAVTERTRAIIPVHLYGQAADMDPLLEIARRHGLKVIEDAAQAHGARYRGRVVGGLADAACFSFFPGKNLGAYGDAGMVVTDDKEIAEKLRMIRNHGRKTKYEYLMEGYNFRIDALQAAILRAKLGHLEDWIEGRRRNAALYDEMLSGVPVVIPKKMDYGTHVYHLYVIQSERRDDLRKFLESKEIQTGIHYPLPLHLQPVYEYLGYKEGDFPVTERLAGRICSLPMFPELKKEAIGHIAELIEEFHT